MDRVLYRVFENVPVWLLGTRFKARNCISEPGPQDPYREIFLKRPAVSRQVSVYQQSNKGDNIVDTEVRTHYIVAK
jgi:hypothetical protein